MQARIIEKDRGYKALDRRIKGFRGDVVAVGVLESTSEREGEDGLTNVKLAGVHEYGREDGSIPERSWNRGWVDENVAQVRQWKRALAKKVLKGELTEKQALGQLGALVEAGMKGRIQSHIDPPLKESTKKARASRHQHGKSGDVPLYDFGLLINSIVHEVRHAK